MTPADDTVGRPSSSSRFSDLSDGSDRLSLQFVAHELNALLDGSMRRLRLAKRGLSPTPTSDAAEAVRIHLEAAEAAMARMTRLLEQTMQQASAGSSGLAFAPSRLFSSSISLADAIAETLESLGPRATEAAVEIRVAVDPAVANVVVGPLVAVLHNGLQNAIDACAATTGGPRRIELLAQRRACEIVVDILDTGPGLGNGQRTSPRGHGIGLNLSRLIMEELGGSLELSSIPFAPGAVLELRVPLARLRRS